MKDDEQFDPELAELLDSARDLDDVPPGLTERLRERIGETTTALSSSSVGLTEASKTKGVAVAGVMTKAGTALVVLVFAGAAWLMGTRDGGEGRQAHVAETNESARSVPVDLSPEAEPRIVPPPSKVVVDDSRATRPEVRPPRRGRGSIGDEPEERAHGWAIPSAPVGEAVTRPNELALLREARASIEPDPERALAILEDLRRRPTASTYEVEREVLTVRALLAAGRVAEANRRFDGVAQDHPDNPAVILLRSRLVSP